MNAYPEDTKSIEEAMQELLLAYAAEERKRRRQLQAAGIAEAQARGVHFGRRPMERPPRFPELAAAWADGEVSARQAAKELGITHRTFLSWVRSEPQ